MLLPIVDEIIPINKWKRSLTSKKYTILNEKCFRIGAYQLHQENTINISLKPKFN